jgi:hypothetical protein
VGNIPLNWKSLHAQGGLDRVPVPRWRSRRPEQVHLRLGRCGGRPDLKNSSGGDIGVHGSISVAQALLAADVIDEVRLAVAPAIAGHGRRLLDGLPSTRLELLHGMTSPSGFLLADYRIVR